MNNDLLIIAAAALAVWVIVKKRPVSAAATGTAKVAGFVGEVQNNALPGQDGYGWDYFANGAVISPDGAYWFQGQKVWQPV